MQFCAMDLNIIWNTISTHVLIDLRQRAVQIILMSDIHFAGIKQKTEKCDRNNKRRQIEGKAITLD